MDLVEDPGGLENRDVWDTETYFGGAIQGFRGHGDR